MVVWSVKPVYKKSIIERQTWENGGESFVYETGWRWGEFLVYTDDETPPKLVEGVDIFNCDYETELVETSDGCWDEFDFDGCSAETIEKLEAYFEEGGSMFELEDEGWYNSETEMIINSEMEIERVKSTEPEVVCESEKLPKKEWPFT
jgi:hypothetical protein